MILLILGFIMFSFGLIGSEISNYRHCIDELDKIFCLMRIIGLLAIIIFLSMLFS